MACNIQSVDSHSPEKFLSDLDCGWISGIVDGEGCFGIIRKRGYYVPTFQIGLRYDDLQVLQVLKAFMGDCGQIHAKKPYKVDLACMCVYKIGGVQDLIDKAIPVFDQCEFHTKKRLEYPLWKEFVLLFLDRNERSGTLERMTEIKREIWKIRHGQCLGFIPKEVREAVDTYSPDWSPDWGTEEV